MSVRLALCCSVLALAGCPVVDDDDEVGGEGEGNAGEGEGEGEGDAGCFDAVFDAADEGAPDVVYVDGFRVGADAACPDGELYEVYFELAEEVAFDEVRASFVGSAAVEVVSVDADFDGHRGDACGPAVTTTIQVGVQVRGAGGASVPVCGTAF